MDELIENSLVDLYRKVALVSKGRILQNRRYSCTLGCPDDWYNRAFDFQGPGGGRELLEQVCDDIRLGNAPRSLLLNASTQSKLSETLLHEYGFRLVYEQIGMAIDLDGWNPAPAALAADYRPIATEADLETWTGVGREAFGDGGDLSLYRSLMKQPDVHLFGCLVSGLVVATALLFVHDGVAGIHHVATSKDWRQRGYGTAVTTSAMRFAKQAGLRWAALQASAMGKGVYARLGFSAFSPLYHWRQA